ncbi:hypothetical protein [Nocardia mikamii]|uniref:hypothetical protein n=1 Tax=Nocardia mikamii TaxID=508464 RepID=UPI0007A413CB|nr:hypothetical protein [Nocardia mikamii]
MPLAVLRPDSELRAKIGVSSGKEWSYSQSCRDWPGSKPHLAILLVPADRAAGAGDQLADQIWGVGIAKAGHKTDADQKVTLSHIHLLQEMVDVPNDWSDDHRPDRLPVTGPVNLNVVSILTSLTQLLKSDAAKLKTLTDLLDERPDWTERALRWRDERDAVLLFAKVAGLTPNSIPSIKDWDRTSADHSFLSGVGGDAVQLAFDRCTQKQIDDILGKLGHLTSRTFIDAANPHAPRHHLELTTIVSGTRVSSSNASIDAYYFHASTGTLVILRYMQPQMLASPDSCTLLATLRDRARNATPTVEQNTDDFRLLKDPLFVRIHDDQPFTPGLAQTSSGSIYPITQVLTEAGRPRSTPARFSRHLVPTDFARLVRDGWFGSRNLLLDDVINLVADSVRVIGHALLVIDLSTRPRGNGSTFSLDTPLPR